MQPPIADGFARSASACERLLGGLHFVAVHEEISIDLLVVSPNDLFLDETRCNGHLSTHEFVCVKKLVTDTAGMQ